ncbi:MAG: hypothetical protein LBJ93_02225 [Clostridiales bacterium]|jgi:hypothetical protein|nr:hypothetical protein [Clostridiales bacterium]
MALIMLVIAKTTTSSISVKPLFFFASLFLNILKLKSDISHHSLYLLPEVIYFNFRVNISCVNLFFLFHQILFSY